MARNERAVVIAMSALGLGSRAPIGLQLAASAVLLAVTLVPSFEMHRERGARDGDAVTKCGMGARPQLEQRGDFVVRTDIGVPVAPAPAALSGWGHPDLAPWPRGMVIGMRPDAHDFVLRSQPGIVDTLLSALVRALQVVSA